MRILFTMAVAALLSGCSRELAGHTANVGEVLAQVEHAQIFKTISEFYRNKHQVPIPYEILSGTATLNSGIATGASPNIAFIGRGVFPGLRLEGNLDFQRTFIITPAMGLSTRLRARALFQYAICSRTPRTTCDFQEFLKEFDKLGSVAPTGQQSRRSDGLAVAVIRLVGKLPQGPLVGDGVQCNNNRTLERIDGVDYCFISTPEHSSQEVEALFTRRLASVTQGIAQGGVITQGTRQLVVPAGPEPLVGRR
jgi:hypothetical protein